MELSDSERHVMGVPRRTKELAINGTCTIVDGVLCFDKTRIFGYLAHAVRMLTGIYIWKLVRPNNLPWLLRFQWQFQYVLGVQLGRGIRVPGHNR